MAPRQKTRLVPNARRLRREMTDAEWAIWRVLRQRPLGYKWRRQHPVCGYIADLACPEAKLIVELDGAQHIEEARYDAIRTAKLEAAGWRVMRFWNYEALTETEGVCEAIIAALPHPASKGAP